MSKFEFKKLFYTDKELLEIVSIPRSFLYKLQNEWIAKGGDPADMGKIFIQGNRKNYWNAPKFLKWLLKYKVSSPTKYDYEVSDKEISERALLIFNKNNERKISI